MEAFWDSLNAVLGLTVVFSPAVLFVLLGGASLLGAPLSERTMTGATQVTVSIGFLAAVILLLGMLKAGLHELPVELGNWVAIPDQHFHFHVKFVFDRLSVPFVILIYGLCGTVGAFTTRYLHREPGFGRFFFLYSVFVMGMVFSSLAGTIETLFFGWELVGLSSALLVAYFHERANPVRNGQRVWCVYRVADAAFLVAAILVHHQTGSGDFSVLMGDGVWPAGTVALSEEHALWVGVLLLVAAAGKSALVPFSGWLPRAMEGPTPSSAVFYGALSVHLGVFLLLRVGALIERSLVLILLVSALGLITAVYAMFAGRVQSDIKSALAFASLTQVGIIVFEIGIGLRFLPLIHILGHACLRTLQLLRAPTLLHDFHRMENAVGGHLKSELSFWQRWIPEGARLCLYRFSLERGFFDGLLDDYVVRPVSRTFRWCNRMEESWTGWLSKESKSAKHECAVSESSVEDYAK